MALQAAEELGAETFAAFAQAYAAEQMTKPLALPSPQVAKAEFARLSEVQTLYHAKRALRRICDAAGLSAFALMQVRSDGPALIVEMITSSWNGDPSGKLKSLAETSPCVRADIMEGTIPFVIESTALAETEGTAATAQTFLCLPLYCERARAAMLFPLEGDRPVASAYGELHLFSLYLFARLTGLLRQKVTTTPLAPRETECLRWSAAGKTSSEIAGIIGVSENTVNSYLASAAQKMNAVNRVQTVAQAIRLGLLG